MIIYPAIDIKDGKCVRLAQGDFEKVTVFSNNPLSVAQNWESKGAEFIHLVDLDGARIGISKNLKVISEIAHELDIPCQLGGGIRTLENIEMIIKAGIKRVILGTAAVQDSNLVREAIDRYNTGIAIGIDAKDNKVAINGWEDFSEYTPLEFGKKMESLGVKTIIYTDISRDGMLSGPNIKSLEEMNKELKDVDIIASGGVTSYDDLKMIEEAGFAGVIIGRALYTSDIDLEHVR
ncbi:MAG: 1-(5-phosphoribosyl)-5-[(5-phosphoribosylamino)methylideneamino]imidazole-4-carboxamide isomerase [Clostridiales bacterium]